METELREDGTLLLPPEVTNALGPGPVVVQWRGDHVEIQRMPSQRKQILRALFAHFDALGLKTDDVAREVEAARADRQSPQR